MNLRLHLLRVGYCRQLACMAARGDACIPGTFPALCALISHPRYGHILYDTGYAEHFFHATQQLPERLYRLAAPVTLPAQERLGGQLARYGLRRTDIRRLIISHCHGDHIAGLQDFPHLRFTALRAATAHILALRGQPWRATCSGYLPALLPADFIHRVDAAEAAPCCTLPVWMHPFRDGFDLLGDGSLIGVTLPGHSHGQLGLFMPQANGRPAFLIADACWSLPALRDNRPPARAALLALSDTPAFMHTFNALVRLQRQTPALALLPSHCQQAWQEWQDAD